MNRLRLEAGPLLPLRSSFPVLQEKSLSQAILAFPQLAKYDKQWPAIDLVRQYLENSASYRTKKVFLSNPTSFSHPTLKNFLQSQATVTLKKRLAATDGTGSRARKSSRRGVSDSVIPTRSAQRRGQSYSPGFSTPGSPQQADQDQQPFVQGSSKTYDYGSQLYTYPPPPPVNDPTTNHGWYGGYSYSQTSQSHAVDATHR